jgi:hypothetical protein
MKTLVTSELFSDFIECRYKAYLKITGANGQKPDLVDVSGRLRESYHSRAREHLLRAYNDGAKRVCTDAGLSVVLANRYDLAIDVTATDTTASLCFDALMAAPGNVSEGQPDYIPCLFVNNDKISREDELRLALCASVLIRWHACRPSFGRILYGSDFRIRKVNVDRIWMGQRCERSTVSGDQLEQRLHHYLQGLAVVSVVPYEILFGTFAARELPCLPES